jgi:hypothetical protein
MSEVAQLPRRGRRLAILLLVVLALGVGAAAWSLTRSTPPNSQLGPEGVLVFDVPNLGNAATTVTGKTVDGISCRTAAKEFVKYHIHVHVSVYVNGKMMRLPAGIGITQPQLVTRDSTGVFDTAGRHDCLYWLHTHAADGIIHVEAPAKQIFTLGQFFDVWNQPLGPEQAGPAKGKVVVFENGKELGGDPRATPLNLNSVVQLDVGNPVVPFQRFPFKVIGSCGAGTTSCSISLG